MAFFRSLLGKRCEERMVPWIQYFGLESNIGYISYRGGGQKRDGRPRNGIRPERIPTKICGCEYVLILFI